MASYNPYEGRENVSETKFKINLPPDLKITPSELEINEPELSVPSVKFHITVPITKQVYIHKT